MFLFSAAWTSRCRWLRSSSSTCGVFPSSEHSSVMSSPKSWKVRSQLRLLRSPARHRTTYLWKVGHRPKHLETIQKEWNCRALFIYPALLDVCLDPFYLRPLQARFSKVGLCAKYPQTSGREAGGLGRSSEGVQHKRALPDGSVYAHANTTPDTNRSVWQSIRFSFLIFLY